MAKKNSKFQITATLDGELACVITLTDGTKKGGTTIDSAVNPSFNLLKLAELFGLVSQHIEAGYYMHEVKSISREAREAIEKALRDENIDAAPF